MPLFPSQIDHLELISNDLRQIFSCDKNNAVVFIIIYSFLFFNYISISFFYNFFLHNINIFYQYYVKRLCRESNSDLSGDNRL